jgi:small conductance mechanosensitive channel
MSRKIKNKNGTTSTVVNKYLEKITDFGFEYVPKLIGGILVLFIGLWITNLITKGLKNH